MGILEERFKYKPVRVAVIDSGISVHEKIDKKIVKYKINIESDGNINTDVEDFNGHGTAIASILSKDSNLELYIIKVLDRNKKSTVQQVIEAINIAIDRKVDIINLSLGTEDFEKYNEMKVACDRAKSNKIFVISAYNNKCINSLPYDLDSVIKVKPYLLVKNNKVLYSNNIFIGKGMPTMVPWINSSYALMGGSSFAAPYVTLALSDVLRRYREYDYDGILEAFINSCELIDNIDDFYPVDKIKRIEEVKNLELDKIVSGVIKETIGETIENKILFQQGLSKFKCYSILKEIEKYIDFKFPYEEFTLEDFIYKKNLVNKIEILVNKNGGKYGQR